MTNKILCIDHDSDVLNPGRLALTALMALVLCLLAVGSMPAGAQVADYVLDCRDSNDIPVKAYVVAMDQVITYNRMGAFAPAGMIFALQRDVFPNDYDPTADENGPYSPLSSCREKACTSGQVHLRPDKRPRPLNLRVNEGCRIEIHLKNLLFATGGGNVGPANPIVEDALNEAPGINLCEPLTGDPPAAFEGIGVKTTRAPNCLSEQPATRNVGIHIHGMIPEGGVANDGSNVGNNGSSLATPGGDEKIYTVRALREGAYTITSGPNLGGEGGSGAIASGLFGVLNVEPAGSIWYRSQVTQEDMLLAASAWEWYECPADANAVCTSGWRKTADNKPNAALPSPRKAEDGPLGHPILNYDAVFPDNHPYAGKPILKILDGNEIFHNNLNAVIAPIDPDVGFPNDTDSYELYPNRDEAFREHTIVFHDEVKMVQAFPEWYNQLKFTLGSVKDGFAVNYGTGGVGSEVIGNRLGVGPMHECAECKYEEFFLTAWAVGDPAMIVDIPANQGLELCGPAPGDQDCEDVDGQPSKFGAKATKAFYADDPSNVHHGYINDRTKIRNIHVGTEHHIFHLHAHQWNFAARDKNTAWRDDNREDWGYDQTNYLDSQGIGPGSSFSYEITFGGGGNRHKQPGDAIFHCHFYPHFAQGMWGLWRVHDVFEEGSTLDATGRVLERGLPDSEICADGAGGSQCGGYDEYGEAIAGGTPVPGVVPLPGKAMAPMPGTEIVALKDTNNDNVPDAPACDLNVEGDCDATEKGKFQGFPFYIAGKAGHRPPTPPTDLIQDGGLPRHIIESGAKNQALTFQNATNFDAVLGTAVGRQLPEAGTLAERVAMAFHGPQDAGTTGHVAFHNSYTPDGTPVSGTSGFEVNGLLPQHSAPYADPCRGDFYNSGKGYDYGGETNSPDNIGKPVGNPRSYAASVIEVPAQLNKVGWHYAQQRLIVLDGDVEATLDKSRAPEPFVIRGNTNDCIDFNHTNLAPSVWQLDDFQVRTPTDVIGQHIHLVKFDVSSADGAANGWNYEDATLSPHEVQERIEALHAGSWHPLPEDEGGVPTLEAREWVTKDLSTGELVDKPCPPATAAHPGGCSGARTTRQRWYVDPGWRGNVFTHDHLGPSTHQQAGLYGVLLVEAEGSKWYDPTTGEQYGTQPDGGPTSWRADIHAPYDAYREFFLEFADFQLAYRSPDTTSWQVRTDFDPVTGAPIYTTRSFTGDGEGGNAVDELGNPVNINLNGPNQAINPSYRNEVGLPHVLQSNVSPLPLPTGQPVVPGCGQGTDQPGWTGCAPEAISAADPGTFVVNMRNEPMPMRVRDPLTNAQSGIAAGDPMSDLSHVYRSGYFDPDTGAPVPLERADPRLNKPVAEWPYNNATTTQTANHGALTGDPFTPLLRAYEGDKVMLRVQVGAHEEGHNISINGVRWLQNWQAGASGFRNSQFAGISEYFIFHVPGLQAVSQGPFADYRYQMGASTDAQWNGSWGIMRSYDGSKVLGTDRPDLIPQPLVPLPNNLDGKAIRMNPGMTGQFCATGSGDTMQVTGQSCNRNSQCERKFGKEYYCATIQSPEEPAFFAGVCPQNAPERKFDIVAVRAADVLPDVDGDNQGDLVYNNKPGEELWDPTALMYVMKSDLEPDLDGNLKLRASRRVEPLILRAAAGDCIFITLTNQVGTPLDFDGFNTLPMIVHQFNNNQVAPSMEVGLHPQLVEYDMSSSDGMNVGFNPIQTAAPGQTVKYKWYAGRVVLPKDNELQASRRDLPVEFGAINLMPSDPIEGASKGLIAAMVIEPQGSWWNPEGEPSTNYLPDGTATTNLLTRAAVTIYESEPQPGNCSIDTTRQCQGNGDCGSVDLGSFCGGDVNSQSCSNDRQCRRLDTQHRTCQPVIKDTGACNLPDPPAKLFRDLVVLHQDNVNMRCKDCNPPGLEGWPANVVPTVSHEEEPEDSGMKGLNYRTDPIWHRLGVGPTAAANRTRTVDYTDAFSLNKGAPQTPVFEVQGPAEADAADRIRLRVLQPGGHNRNHVVTLHGFLWPRYPFSNDDFIADTDDDSARIQPDNPYTFWHGEQMGHGPTNHINVVPLGGCPAAGDFLYRDMVPVHVDNGQWAIVRCP